MSIPFEMTFTRKECTYRPRYDAARFMLVYEAFIQAYGFFHRAQIKTKSDSDIRLSQVEMTYLKEQEIFAVLCLDQYQKAMRVPMRYTFLRNESETYSQVEPFLSLPAKEIPQKGVFRVIVSFNDQTMSSEPVYLKELWDRVHVIPQRRQVIKPTLAGLD